MKSDQSVPLRTLLLSLIVSALSLTFVACEPDNGGGIDVGGSGDDTDETTSFVAVTGSVGDFGCTYADISGYANLHLLPKGSDNPVIGVELVEADAESNANAIQSTSRVLSGNKFSVSFLDLSPSTSYKYRSFVTNGEFTYYGEKYNTFTTKSIMGLTFANVSSDVKRTSAVLHTSVYTDSVDLRDDYLVGFAWSPSESEICAGGEFDSCHCSLRHIKGDRYSASLNDLSEGTTYYYASFTELSGLYVFSSVKSFTTGVLTNLVGDVEVSDITRTSAVLSAVVQTAGVAAEDNLHVGLAWSTSESDLCVGGKYESIKTSVQDISDGRLSASLSELTEGTTYYYASFTESDGAYVFSSVKSFTTGVLTNLVGDVEVSDITRTSAILSAVVQTAGVAAEDNLHVGLAWSTSESALCAGGKYESIKTSVLDISDGRLSASLSELAEGTTYYYASFTESDGAYVFSSVKSFTTSAIQFETGAVDLGLSVKWAGCNVGAESPEEYGDYFAWGETVSKSSYTETNSHIYGYDVSELKSQGVIDSDGNLTASYDAATVNLGDNWRMPTSDEIKELIENCTWEWTTLNGVNGYMITGPSGKSIFLPAASYGSGTSFGGVGDIGGYWAATISTFTNRACSLDFDSYGYDWRNYNRYFGLTVRPIYGTPRLNITITTGDASAITTNSATLGGTVSGSDKSVTCGIIYGTSSTLSSTSGTKKSTTSSGSFSVDVTGLSPNTTYYYCAYVVVDGEYKYGDVLSFTTEVLPLTAGEAIDLGLSVKWANYNVGARSPEDYGGYYAWGETEEKSDYSWSTYKWCNGSSTTLTKYCTDSYYGKVDNKTTLDPDDDVAYVKWGGDWRMPTLNEFDELKNNCTWSWTSVNGVKGYRVTGPNGNSIFLPAAGYRYGGDFNFRGTYGYYWSATLFEDYNTSAYCLYFSSGYQCNFIDRSNGRTVRPVYGAPQLNITVTTGDATAITANSAILGGTVSGSNKSVTCGIIYGTSSTLSSTSGTKKSTTSSGSFSVDVTGLSPSTTYYYCAYVVVDEEYKYGEVRSFTTAQEITVTTGDASAITTNSATLGGAVSGSDKSVTCGIIYGTSSTLSSTSGTKKSTTSSGSFSIDVTGLSPNTTYYYCAYVVVDGEYKYGDVLSFTTEALPLTAGEAIDLGLSVKWANYNVGARSPEDYGGYYAWGETEEKSDYSWSTYKWCNGSSTTLTKYCTNSSYGKVDNKTTLDPDDDVAYVKWGGDWRMPTLNEFDELKNNCTWSWTSVNGVKGYRVTGPNGNSIFLPATGLRNGEDIYNSGPSGYYWSATLDSYGNYAAYYLCFYDGYYDRGGYNRYYGRPVRPVYGTPQLNITVSTGDASAITTKSATLGGTVNGSSKSVTCGIIYGTSSSLSSTSGTKKSTTSSGSFSVDVTGLSPSTTYYYRAYVVVDGEYKYGEVRSFTTEALPLTAGEAIDLGLSVKWANYNVGARSPEDYGGYYAWGETEEKSNYSWSTYKWCNGSSTTLTKYCTNSSYGKVDNKTTLDPEDDVAYVKWGGDWRMPTLNEFDELKNNCTWSWTSVNGVKGYRVTGPNGNSIFLPATGYRNGRDVSYRGTSGNYWSATLYGDYSGSAYYLYFEDVGSIWDYNYRNNGRPVRPVYGTPQLNITVSTGNASAITTKSATLGGTVSGSSKSVTCGIIYGTSSTLSSTSGTKKSTTSSGSFSVDVTDLSPSTTYYYRAYVVVDGEYKYGDVLSFTTEADISVTEGDVIDLGLSVKWASCNVGAQSPEEYGDYFACGETEPKSNYSSSNSVTNDLSLSELQSRGIIGADGNLTAAYDAATANWGSNWRMPTLDEMKELINSCTWEWTTMNSVEGHKVTGPNGNSIFLPAAGHRSGPSLAYAGGFGSYWSATPYTHYAISDRAYGLGFNSDDYDWSYHRRYDGLTIRPVYGTPRLNVPVTTGDASAITTKSATLGGTVNGSSKSVTCGIIYGTSSTLSSTSGTKKSTTSSGSFSVDVTSLSSNTTYYYRAYVYVDGEYKYGDVRSFKTKEAAKYTAVDLGLSVKWASFNVGATSPEDYGDYFAWGETKPKSSYTSNNSVTYGLSTSELKSRGIIGADGNLTASYDAATTNWGGNWRMPTLIEMKELINNCTWEWTTMYGVKGRKVTGPNGNFIFLPAAGYRGGSSLSNAGSSGYYWSATPNSDSNFAYGLYFDSGYYGWDYGSRYDGRTVRPVSE